MGLDQYAYAVAAKYVTKPVDFEIPEKARREELAYWRKHPNLQGWMRELYIQKGGGDQDFNCVPVQITEEDLDALERDVLAEDLPETSGFFFGSSRPEDKDDDLAFIHKAREALRAGKAVYYSSWW